MIHCSQVAKNSVTESLTTPPKKKVREREICVGRQTRFDRRSSSHPRIVNGQQYLLPCSMWCGKSMCRSAELGKYWTRWAASVKTDYESFHAAREH